MLFLVLILTVVLLLVAYQEYKYGKMRETIRHTPGPKTLPFIGNALQLGQTLSDVLNFFFDNWYEYGQNNFRFWIGYYLNIMVSDVKDIEFILSNNTLIGKSDIYDMLHPWLGQGLLTSKGSHWHKHRKMITPSFHFKILQDFHDVMNHKSTIFIEKLRKVSKNGSIFDFQDIVGYFTLDVLCETAMGVNINAMEVHDSDFVRGVNFLCSNIQRRVFHPLKRKLATFKLFPEYKNYSKHLQSIQDFTYDVIERRIQARQFENANKTSDVLEANVFAKGKMAFLDNLLSSTIDGRPLSRQEVYEEVSTFMFAGHDTTTSALSFAVFLLSRHLAVQQKAFEEQLNIFGANYKRDATFEEISEMKYLDLVIKETLRLYPSVPIIGRHTEKDYNINGKIIPADTSLNIFIMALGYDEKLFPDPYRFNPERFQNLHFNEKFSPYAYIPFSAGPRNCVGQKFAMNEIKTVLSKIVRYFEILPPLDELASTDGYVSTKLGPFRNKKSHKYDPVLSTVITLKSETGVFVRLNEKK